MKRILYIMIVLVFYSCANLQNPQKIEQSDILGAWLGSSTLDACDIRMAVGFFANGSTSGCIEFKFDDEESYRVCGEEKWELKGDIIEYEVVSTSNEKIYKIGQKSSDKILNVKKDQLILQSIPGGDVIKLKRMNEIE